MADMHAVLRSRNILAKDGRLSGIIVWENSGWLPRRWQLYVMRRSSPNTRGKLAKIIHDKKSPDESEAAFISRSGLVSTFLYTFIIC